MKHANASHPFHILCPRVIYNPGIYFASLYIISFNKDLIKKEGEKELSQEAELANRQLTRSFWAIRAMRRSFIKI